MKVSIRSTAQLQGCKVKVCIITTTLILMGITRVLHWTINGDYQKYLSFTNVMLKSDMEIKLKIVVVLNQNLL